MADKCVAFDAPEDDEPQVRESQIYEGPDGVNYSAAGDGCDWGGCDADSTCERWCARVSRWIAVCAACAKKEEATGG